MTKSVPVLYEIETLLAAASTALSSNASFFNRFVNCVLPLSGAHNYPVDPLVNEENCLDLSSRNQAKARSPDTLAVVRNAGPRGRQYTVNVEVSNVNQRLLRMKSLLLRSLHFLHQIPYQPSEF